MSVRFKREGAPRQPHFIKEWRLRRGLTLERLAETLEISSATLSRLENGKQPYTQDVLEALAATLDCSPADLISRHPSASPDIWELLSRASLTQRDQIAAIAKTIVDGARDPA